MGDTLAQAGLLTPITINTWARLRTAKEGHLDELADTKGRHLDGRRPSQPKDV